jgi:hypothetical protein
MHGIRGIRPGEKEANVLVIPSTTPESRRWSMSLEFELMAEHQCFDLLTQRSREQIDE